MRMSLGKKSTGTGAERRKYPRKPLEEHALLMILTGESDVLERAHVRDISFGGVCFTRVEALKGFEKDQRLIATHQPVIVYFENNPLTLFGTVVRHDAAGGGLALAVRRSTNEELWEGLCA